MAVPERSSDARTSTSAAAEGARDLIVILAGALLAAGFLSLLLRGESTRFEDLGLGKETTPIFASFEGDPIHCHDLRDVAECLAGFRRRGTGAAALWLGNSQLHGVNQWRPEQETAAARLFTRLREQGVDLVTLSQPNANFQEHLVLYAYLRTRLPLRLLLLPAVFDDARETGIRATVASALEDDATRAALEASAVGRRIVSENRDVSDPDLAALDETLQEGSEAWLTGWLDRHVELWSRRPEARGTFGYWLVQVRNTVFGITTQSKRRLVEGRYVQNLDAARAILADAEAHGVRVLLYVAPVRNDVAIPYVASEYERFKREVEELATLHHASFVDLEGVVPGPMWGVMRAETLGEDVAVDFMHFQAGGHAILADRLARALGADGASR